MIRLAIQSSRDRNKSTRQAKTYQFVPQIAAYVNSPPNTTLFYGCTAPLTPGRVVAVSSTEFTSVGAQQVDYKVFGLKGRP